MRSVESVNAGWTFHEGFDERLCTEPARGQSVRLPHTAVELPLNYFDESVYQREFTYQKLLEWRPDFENREVFLVFDGAMADAAVYLNGELVASHRDGYTPFEARLTGMLRRGGNLVAVKVDGTENPGIPPFGGQIDYLTYAGIYRDVWLRVTDAVWIDSIKIETPNPLAEVKSAIVKCGIRNAGKAEGKARVMVRILDADGVEIAAAGSPIDGETALIELAGLRGIRLWDLDSPALYRAMVEVVHAGGRDEVSSWFGFRAAEFAADGFRLNGRRVKIRGLNRHQSYPYVGYAMGRRAQERDAEILKRDLKCNLVRTSHYPQSPWFLDHCDRIGLMVFEEIPGWQHIGGDGWRSESVKNVERMIRRDWNHPSIVLWGVRINESADSHDFYSETNALAGSLDSTRQTAGVRNIANSELLEDVYTMNDFINGSEEPAWVNRHRIPLRKQREVTGLDRSVPYLVTEFNGHMHPTKISDPEQRQAEHVTRYLEVLNAAYGDIEVSGSIGWCMFDYNTHKDFGSGDRICHHGVLDMFREPKFAADVYASQCDPSRGVVLRPVTFWARGERSIGSVLPLIVLTNCEEVELKYGGGQAKRATPDRGAYPHLPYAPVVFDHRHFPLDDLGMWGMQWDDMTLTGFIGGEPARRLEMVANPVPSRLRVVPDQPDLIASEKDAVKVSVHAVDQVDSILPFLTDPLFVSVTGPARLVGPECLAFRGGVAAFWLESTGGVGTVGVEVASPRLAPAMIELDAVMKDPLRRA